MAPVTFPSDRLRRCQSTRSIRSSKPSAVPLDATASFYAAAAASHAMERASTDSRSVYDCVDGPRNVAVPYRSRSSRSSNSRYTTSISSSEYEAAAGTGSRHSAILFPIDEGPGIEYGRELIPLPSSYRRLRKSKSMFTPRRSHFGGRSTPTMRQDSVGGSSRTSRADHHPKSSDAAIRLARSQFFQGSNSLSTTPGHLSPASTLRPEHRLFKKTLRATSQPKKERDTHSFGRSWNGHLHGKARNFSHNVKTGIRRLLRLSRPRESAAGDGVQGNFEMSTFESSQGEDQGPAASEISYTAINTNHSPSLPIRGNFPGVSGRESLRSKSRVTSWADSTVEGIDTTVRLQDQPSVVQEPYSHLTLRGSQSPSPILGKNSSPSIDGRRLYSALMRHISEEQSSEDREDGDTIVLGSVTEGLATRQFASHHSSHSVRPAYAEQSGGLFGSPSSFATAHTRMSQAKRPASAEQSEGLFGSPTATPRARMSPDKRSPFSGLRNEPDDSALAAWEQERNSDEEEDWMPRQSSKEQDSPSVYSRATGVNTPADEIGVSRAEPGMATIYETRRSPYSPRNTRSSDSFAVTQPSGEWKQWAQLQMANIESLPRHHYRENAQLHDDGEDSALFADFINAGGTLADKKRQPSTSSRISETSNFSRPFNRSPVVHKAISPQRNAPSTAIRNPSQQQTSPSSSTTSIIARVDKESQSPLSVRAQNAVRHQESPTPKNEAALTQKMWASEQTTSRRVRPSSAFQNDAQIAQFHSIRAARLNRRSTENVKNENRRDPGAGVGDGYRTLSGRQMVDRFLETRRQENRPDSGPGVGNYRYPTLSGRQMVERFLESRRQRMSPSDGGEDTELEPTYV